MDTYSQISMDSEDSIPKNVYEEVIVDSTIHPFDPKDNVVDELVDEPKINDEAMSGSEDETDDDADSNFSSSTPPIIEKERTPSDGVESTCPDINPSSSEESKAANLKLVLKKSPDFQLSTHSIVQAKTSPNKIFLLTLVSNTVTGPIYSTAKYSVAGEANAEKSTKIVPAISNVDDDRQIAVLKKSLDSDKTIKTYGKDRKPEIDDIKMDAEKPFENENEEKDETDVSSIKSEIDMKTSTPKIKRELKQLQKTVNESKILSEYMNDYAAKCRKARKVAPLKNRSDSEGSPVFSIRSRSRSCSKPRLESPVDNIKLDRWPSEEKINKRQNMRSQNTDFVQKHMKFLNSIQSDDITDNSDGDTSIIDGKSSSNSNVENHQPVAKRNLQPPPKPGWDCFCFKCHSGGDLIACTKCIRSYHSKCVKNQSPLKSNTIWHCPECIAIENCLKTSVRSGKSNFTLDHLGQLLQFALKRMKQWKGSDNFLKGRSDEDYPEYSKYVINPVTLEKLQIQIENKTYKCTEEFAVDAKWILHNSSVYFGNNTKLTNIAKSIVKVCRQEVTEIDTCAECYYNANTRKDWFVEVCSKPHILLWAKLKGFPYWPAKAMGFNAALVNVRFFGDHDRAYVPIKDCFLYSEQDPNPPTKQNKRSTIAECIKEVDIHLRKITAKFGSFIFPPFRTSYDPSKENSQLEMMIPGINELLNSPEKSSKPALTYKIVKTADNHLSIIKKTDTDTEPVNSNTSINTIDTQSGIDGSKERVKSTDSSHSNNDLSSSSETLNIESEEKVTSERKSLESTKTYEVVSKAYDTEQTKVNSVILKRKSDNWNAVTPSSSVSKKHKVIPEVEPAQEQPVTSSDDHLPLIPNEIPIQKPIIASVKRKRSRDENTQKVQKQKIEDDKIPPLVLLTPFVMSTTNSCLVTSSTIVPSLAVVTSLNSSVSVTISQSSIPSTSTVDTNAVKTPVTTISSVKLFDNAEISIKRVPKKSTKDVPSDNVPVINEKDESCISSTKEKDTGTTNTPANKAPEASGSRESVQTVSTESTKKLRELIPFEEIKTEKPDSNDMNEPVEIRSKTATPEPSSSKSSTAAVRNAQDVNFMPVVIKTEPTSEDEDSSNQSKPEENINSETSATDLNIKRVTVKDISKLRVEPVPNKKVDAAEKKKPATKPESKKQRARKSFPNKSNFYPATTVAVSLTTPPVNKRPVQSTFIPQKNLNSMVYIPVDTKTSSAPISTPTPTPISAPILTAVSKTVSSSNQVVSINPVGTNLSNVTVTSLPTTTLTTSIQLPIVYSAISQGTNSSEHMLAGFVTPTLASAITDTIVKGPPKLAPRPTGPLRSDGDYVFPSEAGPVSKMLMNNAHKMTDFFRSVIEDSLSDMAGNQNLEAKVKLMEIELEKLKYTHDKELAELKHNTDLMLCEMRTSLENEKTRLIAETRKQCELERIRAVEDAKTKQWCASCGKEAQFYCCWNTSYCDYPCQQKHWTRHMNSCAQKDNADANAQKIGVKISPYNLKERQTKNKDSVISKLPNHIIRANIPVASRNSVPSIKRLVPITAPTTPQHYALINSQEGSWGLVKSPPFPRILPTPGLLMTDSSSKAITTPLPGTIIRTTKL